jgi:hypothetical protein
MTLNYKHRSRLLVEVLVAGCSAEVEENMITWTSPKQIFEMPTGGAAIMRNGIYYI